MIFRLGAAIDRRRRPILIAAALLTALVVAAHRLGADPDSLGGVLFVPMLAAVVLSLVIRATTALHKRSTFLLDESGRAFRTPRSGTIALLGVFHLGMLGLLLLDPPDFAHGTMKERLTLPVVALALPLYGRALWHGIGVTLTPEGVHADKFSGSQTFPWEALDPSEPAEAERTDVVISYARPELVEVTGWLVHRNTVIGDGLRQEVVASALRFYTAHPRERALIGTPEGYDRMLRATGTTPPETVVPTF